MTIEAWRLGSPSGQLLVPGAGLDPKDRIAFSLVAGGRGHNSEQTFLIPSLPSTRKEVDSLKTEVRW
jgi:hypothetical protein